MLALKAIRAFRAKPARNQQYWLPAQQEEIRLKSHGSLQSEDSSVCLLRIVRLHMHVVHRYFGIVPFEVVIQSSTDEIGCMFIVDIYGFIAEIRL